MRKSSRFLCLSGAILLSALVGCKSNSCCSDGSCGGSGQTGAPATGAPVYSPQGMSAGTTANKYGSASPMFSNSGMNGGQQSYSGMNGGQQGFPPATTTSTTYPNLGATH